MEENKLLAILADWNFWGGKNPYTGIERGEYVGRIASLLKEDIDAVAEVGVRRCGKSFIAKQVAQKFIADGYGAENTLIINLEDERLLEREYGLLLEIYEIYKRDLSPAKKPLIIIDEAQEVDGWERFVRGLTERKEASFVVTGSSSALLSSEYSTLLSGRQVTVHIAPLSFAEFLGFNGINAASAAERAAKSVEMGRALEEYLRYGGFPAVVQSKAKEELLSTYFDTILVKDVASRYSIRDHAKLRFLAKFYLGNVASSVTYNSIARSTKAGGGAGMPVKTIQRFSEYIESSLMLFFVRRFSFSMKEQENSPRKVYSIDNGFAVLMGSGLADAKGRLMENAVAAELARRSHLKTGFEIYYWKSATSGREVDFVVKDRRGLSAIQVSYETENVETKRRELEALAECSKELELKEGTVITYGYNGTENANGLRVRYVGLADWLLHGA